MEWAYTLLAAAAANWPWLAGRTWRLRSRAALWCAMYAAVVGAGCWMEARAGNVYPKNAVFFATTFLFFVIFSFPAAVWRLWQRRR